MRDKTLWTLMSVLGSVLVIVTFFPDTLLGRMLWFPIPLAWIWVIFKVLIVILASSNHD